jgi:hypothetical protein
MVAVMHGIVAGRIWYNRVAGMIGVDEAVPLKGFMRCFMEEYVRLRNEHNRSKTSPT